MVDIKVLNPMAAVSRPGPGKLAPRLSQFNGKTIGLLWNLKPSGDVVNRYTAELLAEKFKGVKFKNYVGSIVPYTMIRRATPKELDTIAKECVAVVGSLGD